MATYNEILTALASEEGVISTADLAAKVSSTQDTMRANCSQLKKKGFVDGSSKEGWIITTEGREALERHEKIPTTPEDVGADTKSKLEYYGKLAGVPPDLILATSEIILSGDPEDLERVWEAMTQMDVPIPNRRRWFNLWRNYLKQGIPPELREKVSGSLEVTGEEGEEALLAAKDKGRDYIIADDVPVFVGHGQGDFGLKDAKDIIGMRALRSRFAPSAQTGVGQAAGAGGTTEKVSEILTALEPYINKETSNIDTVKEIIADKLALQRQEILSHIPQLPPGQPSQPKSFVEQLTDFADGLGKLKDTGPTLRSILGVPEPSGNPFTPTQVIGLDGQPAVMDLTKVLDLRKFLAEEKRSDERHSMLMGLGQAARERVDTFAEAAKEAIAEVREERKGQTPKQEQQEQLHRFNCGNCQKEFAIRPEDWLKLESGQLPGVTCPHCQSEYTREQVMA